MHTAEVDTADVAAILLDKNANLEARDQVTVENYLEH